ncbi:unnamed protein product [Lepeophtheirus salmonis]|uniref:(salmon louse) hypothetical protein n=1 Tax=Lepeophtheirus salmonis TaxID=72036 RepID=A0A7R8H9J4_LEPSM|nr:unnamed protein product [Lepeophtheirus salmonis]CAF2956016.1 unnamed protein product [Lepeophtheirus salmonis]
MYKVQDIMEKLEETQNDEGLQEESLPVAPEDEFFDKFNVDFNALNGKSFNQPIQYGLTLIHDDTRHRSFFPHLIAQGLWCSANSNIVHLAISLIPWAENSFFERTVVFLYDGAPADTATATYKRTKFALLATAIPLEAFDIIADPESKNDYAGAKSLLLKKFRWSKKERIQRLGDSFSGEAPSLSAIHVAALARASHTQDNIEFANFCHNLSSSSLNLSVTSVEDTFKDPEVNGMAKTSNDHYPKKKKNFISKNNLTCVNDYLHILTVMEIYTRWSEAYPIKGTTENEISKVFRVGWITRNGVPTTIVSDQGTQFTGNVRDKNIRDLMIAFEDNVEMNNARLSFERNVRKIGLQMEIVHKTMETGSEMHSFSGSLRDSKYIQPEPRIFKPGFTPNIIDNKEICDPKIMGNVTMCKQCEENCHPWRLKDACLLSKFTYLFDNAATIFFSIFMSFWDVPYNLRTQINREKHILREAQYEFENYRQRRTSSVSTLGVYRRPSTVAQTLIKMDLEGFQIEEMCHE